MPLNASICSIAATTSSEADRLPRLGFGRNLPAAACHCCPAGRGLRYTSWPGRFAIRQDKGMDRASNHLIAELEEPSGTRTRLLLRRAWALVRAAWGDVEVDADLVIRRRAGGAEVLRTAADVGDRPCAATSKPRPSMSSCANGAFSTEAQYAGRRATPHEELSGSGAAVQLMR